MIVSYVVAEEGGRVYSTHIGEPIDVTPEQCAQRQADALGDTCYLWLGRIDFPVGIFGGVLAEVLTEAGQPFVVARPA